MFFWGHGVVLLLLLLLILLLLGPTTNTGMQNLYAAIGGNFTSETKTEENSRTIQSLERDHYRLVNF